MNDCIVCSTMTYNELKKRYSMKTSLGVKIDSMSPASFEFKYQRAFNKNVMIIAEGDGVNVYLDESVPFYKVHVYKDSSIDKFEEIEL